MCLMDFVTFLGCGHTEYVFPGTGYVSYIFSLFTPLPFGPQCVQCDMAQRQVLLSSVSIDIFLREC